jgi:hypothetical protein
MYPPPHMTYMYPPPHIEVMVFIFYSDEVSINAGLVNRHIILL